MTSAPTAPPGASAWPPSTRRRHRARHVVPRARAGRRARRRRAAGRADRARGHRRRPRRAHRGARSSRSRPRRPPPTSTEDVWLRLHLLSHRLVAPHTISTSSGVFGAARPTSCGPAPVRARSTGFEATRGAAARRGPARHGATASTSSRGWSTTSLPTGVRIADADRVRLGAHLAEGTTVMHEGFVNYNAGTLGASHGRGPDLGGRRRRRRLRRRRRRVDHGHPLRRRQGRSSRSASAACSAPTPASASRSATTAWSRPAATSRPAPR